MASTPPAAQAARAGTVLSVRAATTGQYTPHDAPRRSSPRRWQVLGAACGTAGLAWGIGTSMLNHMELAAVVAALAGSGAGWLVAGLLVALLVGCTGAGRGRGWWARTGGVGCFYLSACLGYYLADWWAAMPGVSRLRDDVAAGRVPAPASGGMSASFDWGEWLVWSVASVPATLLTVLLAHGLRTLVGRVARRRARSL